MAKYRIYLPKASDIQKLQQDKINIMLSKIE